MTNAVYSFLPWVRRGASTGITQADLDSANARASFDVVVTVNPGSTAAASETVPISLYGPGDVVGFEQARVLRTEPNPFTTNFEPNYFAAIEFDLPDFVWLMTPAKPGAGNKLRPWICLVVVKQEKATLSPGANGGLPVLENHSDPLPDLAEAWAWAHSQVLGTLSATDTLDALLASSPERLRCRLVCPRKLDANTAYYACVVPTTAAGRAAGLGGTIPGNLAPAWSGNGAGAKLPVYYSWQFATGAQGDFESLARLIRGRTAPPGTGRQHMDVRNAGLGLDPAVEQNMGFVGFDGALLAPGLADLPWTGDKGAFQAELADRIDEPATLTSGQPSQPGVVGPPLYAGTHVGKRTLPAAGQAPAWLRTLNLEPAYRAVAALGARVIESDQEKLMDAAWRQVGQVQAANEALRKAQLARAAARRIHKTIIARFPPAGVLQFAGPAVSRISLDAVHHTYGLAQPAVAPAPTPAPRGTLEREVLASRLPASALTVAFRRVTRPTGPVVARVTAKRPRPTVRPFAQRLNEGKIAGAGPARAPEGAAPIDLPGKPPLSPKLTPEAIRRARPHPGYVPLPPGTRTWRDYDAKAAPLTAEERAAGDNPAAAAFRSAAIRMQTRLQALPKQPPPAPPPLNLRQLKATLLDRLDPRLTIPHAVRSRLSLPAATPAAATRSAPRATATSAAAFSTPAFSWVPEDPIEPILAAPSFDRPMYEPLRDLFKDAFVPGAGPLEPNSVMLLKTNPRFVEAYMVGLNHKFAQLLLWRGYPTDGRGTSFRQFWDSRGHVPPPTTDAEKAALLDVPPIHAWAANKPFGGHARGNAPGGLLVLLVAAELLNRYPNLVIYASEADRRPLTDSELLFLVRQPKTSPPNNLFPVFRGTLPPNITFLGFELSVEKARGGPAPPLGSTDPDPGNGWFLVFEQQPTEPRFGFDETRSDTLTLTNLGWNDVGLSNSHVSIAATRTALQAAGAAKSVYTGWATDAGALAVQTLQSPFRVAISADDLLPAA